MEPAKLESWLAHHLGVVVAASFGWVILMAVITGLLRKRSGLPVLRPEYADAIFRETWTTVAGRAMGEAQNCAWLILTPAHLQIGMHFPFSVGIPTWLARWFGLEAKIPLERIVRVERVGRGWFGSMVAVSWREDSATRTLKVRIRKEGAFMETLKQAARAKGAMFA